ncbi:hypothetical protein [Acidisphaera sp. S103]|uniref:hypothetical protein n=1 Tax=Acidisphaera sp. S103 TaxID=1747223 RepID=UPI00131BC99A|nr:hypothetical protein [Acidisphaera sp. S103]
MDSEYHTADRKISVPTLSTLDAYRCRGVRLFARFRNELGCDADDITAMDFATWLLRLRPTLRSSSWRLYRAAALHMIRGMPGDEVEAAVALLKAPAPCPQPTVKRGSARKEKLVRKADLDRVLADLRVASRSRLAPVLIDWLWAGVLTGLRPGEWRAAAVVVEDGRVLLITENEKATNGRGLGPTRTLDISAFSRRDLECVIRMAAVGARWSVDGIFADQQAQCGALLHQVCRRLWPGRERGYALYSCRHQFTSNAKAALPIEEVSALLGHIATKTANRHYGRRQSAWSPKDLPPLPRPLPSAIAQVRRNARMCPFSAKAA